MARISLKPGQIMIFCLVTRGNDTLDGGSVNETYRILPVLPVMIS
jgi:hypothetical protein